MDSVKGYFLISFEVIFNTVSHTSLFFSGKKFIICLNALLEALVAKPSYWIASINIFLLNL